MESHHANRLLRAQAEDPEGERQLLAAMGHGGKDLSRQLDPEACWVIAEGWHVCTGEDRWCDRAAAAGTHWLLLEKISGVSVIHV